MNKPMHKQQYITVTIGIPTFNEEDNIHFLLNCLLKQKGIHTKIEKIHIVDDASTDRTVEQINSFRDQRIVLTRHKKRLGQTNAQNFIFQNAATDVVIILEADTYPAENNYIDLMVLPFLKNPAISFVQGNIRPLPSHTLIGKVLYKQAEVFNNLVIQNNAFLYPISTGRGGRAFKKILYKKLRWPAGVPDDDYAVLWCINNNFTRFFQRNAHCYYQRPQTFADYIKEKQKIYNIEPAVRKFFSENVIKQYFLVPKKTQYRLIFTLLKESPLTFCVYSVLNLAERFFLQKGAYTDFWSQTKTTKILQAK